MRQLYNKADQINSVGTTKPRQIRITIRVDHNVRCATAIDRPLMDMVVIST